jgi:hypothetical protein
MLMNSDSYAYSLYSSRRRDQCLWLYKKYLHWVCFIMTRVCIIMKSHWTLWILLSADIDTLTVPWRVTWPALYRDPKKFEKIVPIIYLVFSLISVQ